MRLPRRPYALWPTLAALLLAACGSNTQPGLPPSRLITLPPVPAGTLAAGCETGELESWFEVAAPLTGSFAEESLAALTLAPSDALLDLLSRQSDLIERIVREPVPECAAPVQAEIVRRLRAINTAFSQFQGAAITADELRATVTLEHQALQTDVAGLMSDLNRGLDELYQLETQAASSGG